MQTTEMKRQSVYGMDEKQRVKAGRLIRHALVMGTFAAAVVMVPQAANAATVAADGTKATHTITIDNNNISNPPGGTISDGDTVAAVKGGTLNLINGTSITNSNTLAATNGGHVTASGAGSTIIADNLNVDTTGWNQIVGATSGGHITITGTTGPSTISGTLANYVGQAARASITTVAAIGNDSIVDMTDVTVITSGYNRDYYSTGIAARGGGIVNLTNVTVDSTGDRTYGIWTDGDNGHINGNNVNITTDGDNSKGISAYGKNTTVELTGGSIHTKGTYSAGVQVNLGAEVTLTNMTVSQDDPNSPSVQFSNGTSAAPGTFNAINTTLNGNIVADGAGYGNADLTNGSVLNGSVYLPNGSFTIDSSSTFNNTNPGNAYIHNFTNGTYMFAPPPTDASDPNQYGTLEVDNFTANPGSSIRVNIFADGENSFGNQVIINDSYTGATTTIDKNFTNGYHALPKEGLIVVQGTSPNAFHAGDFFDPTNQGIYTYTGSFSNPNNDPQFALFSRINSAVAAASVLPALGARTILSTLPSVQDRMHAPRASVSGTGQVDANKGVWARLFGGSNKFRSDSSADTGFDTNLWGVQAGYDLMAKKDANGGRSYAGLYLAYGTSSGDAQLNGRDVGSLDLNATSVGAYWTKYSPSDLYLSVTGQYSWLNGVRASGGGESVSPSGSGFALSVEGGKTLNREKSLLIEPQAQLIYQHTDVDDVVLRAGGLRPNDTRLNLDNINSLTGRLGVLLQKNPNSGKNFLPFAKLNLWHTFSGDSDLSSPGSDNLTNSTGGTSLEVKGGFNLLGSKTSRWAIDAGLGYMFDISGAENSGWRGNLGAKYNF